MIDGKPSVNDNPTFDPIIEHLSEVIHEDDTVLIPENIDLIEILPDDLDSFYHYSGSLTTPTCDEVVTWTIFSKPNTMSSAQLQQFRTLTNDESRPLVNNHRPPQPVKLSQTGRPLLIGGNALIITAQVKVVITLFLLTTFL